MYPINAIEETKAPCTTRHVALRNPCSGSRSLLFMYLCVASLFSIVFCSLLVNLYGAQVPTFKTLSNAKLKVCFIFPSLPISFPLSSTLLSTPSPFFSFVFSLQSLHLLPSLPSSSPPLCPIIIPSQYAYRVSHSQLWISSLRTQRACLLRGYPALPPIPLCKHSSSLSSAQNGMYVKQSLCYLLINTDIPDRNRYIRVKYTTRKERVHEYHCLSRFMS